MTVVEICYNVANVLVGIAFLPQIITLARRPSKDKSLNLLTCSLFLLCSIAMLAYAWLQVHDLYFTISAIVNVTGWSSVVSLGSFNRYVRQEAKEDYMVGL